MYEYHYWYILNNFNCEVYNFPIQRGECGQGLETASFPLTCILLGIRGFAHGGSSHLHSRQQNCSPVLPQMLSDPFPVSLRRADVGLFLVFGLIVLFGFYFLIIVLHNEKIWSPLPVTLLSSLSLKALLTWGGEVSNGLSHIWFVWGPHILALGAAWGKEGGQKLELFPCWSFNVLWGFLQCCSSGWSCVSWYKNACLLTALRLVLWPCQRPWACLCPSHSGQLIKEPFWESFLSDC